jgi:glutamyl-tRNA synthetase
MSSPPVTRFAPSPTGLLHVGNIRTALVAWLAVRREGGRFILRIDDTDQGRGSPAFEAAILEDLRWLGLSWDAFARQSDRIHRHQDAIARLKASGRLYPCWETPEELELQRVAARQQGRPPIYDRAALHLSEDEKRRLVAAGRRPHWRFRLDPGEIAWIDRVRGRVHFDAADLSDPILVREDGSPLYHIGSVVDDIELGVTLVVRGEDHVANTATHIQMTHALGGVPPAFAHLPLLADAAGQGLSKRLGSLSLRSLREEQGIEPMAVASLLATIGTSEPIAPHRTLGELVERFDFAHVGRATPRFDPTELVRLNAAILHATPFEEVHDRLVALGADGIDRRAWEAIRPNIERLADAIAWWRVVTGPLDPPASPLAAEDRALVGQALALLPPEPWGDDVWKIWTQAVAASTGRRGRSLFLPLRLALTGLSHGPELRDLLPAIGHAKATERLEAARATAA